MLSPEAKDILLGDFGCGEFFQSQSGRLSKYTRGTYQFMAPELFIPDKTTKKVQGRQSDIWATGITLFYLLTKRFPFEGKNLFDLADKVRGQPPDLTRLEGCNSALIDLISRTLEKDISQRITIYEMIRHDWITDGGNHEIDLDLMKSEEEDLSTG